MIWGDTMLTTKDVIDEYDKRIRLVSKEVSFPLDDKTKKTIEDSIEMLRLSQIDEYAKKYGEEIKVAIRNIRRDYVELAKDDDAYTEDYQKKMLEDLEKVVADSIKAVDQVVADKEKELMSI